MRTHLSVARWCDGARIVMVLATHLHVGQECLITRALTRSKFVLLVKSTGAAITVLAPCIGSASEISCVSMNTPATCILESVGAYDVDKNLFIGADIHTIEWPLHVTHPIPDRHGYANYKKKRAISRGDT